MTGTVSKKFHTRKALIVFPVVNPWLKTQPTGFMQVIFLDNEIQTYYQSHV